MEEEFHFEEFSGPVLRVSISARRRYIQLNVVQADLNNHKLLRGEI